MGVSASPATSTEMAAHRLLLIITITLGIALSVQGRRRARYLVKSSPETDRRALVKEDNNKINHGPEYSSHHKQHHQQMFSQKGGNYHVWASKLKGGGLAKKPKYGHRGEHQLANTKYDHDDINLQRLDSDPITQKKKTPKTFNQMVKKTFHKPNKKMDKMYKKMMEKE